MGGLLNAGAAVGAVGRGGQPCPPKSRSTMLRRTSRGTKAVSLARSVPSGRKRSGPFVSDAKGQAVSQDYIEAAKWFHKAAEQGSASAQERLGVAYAKGQGAPQDYAEALKWLGKAADQGDADATRARSTIWGSRMQTGGAYRRTSLSRISVSV
jgi:Sel1 repeat